MYVYTITTSWYYKDVSKRGIINQLILIVCHSLETELELGKMLIICMILVDRSNKNIDGKRGISTHQR